MQGIDLQSWQPHRIRSAQGGRQSAKTWSSENWSIKWYKLKGWLCNPGQPSYVSPGKNRSTEDCAHPMGLRATVRAELQARALWPTRRKKSTQACHWLIMILNSHQINLHNQAPPQKKCFSFWIIYTIAFMFHFTLHTQLQLLIALCKIGKKR